MCTVVHIDSEGTTANNSFLLHYKPPKRAFFKSYTRHISRSLFPNHYMCSIVPLLVLPRAKKGARGRHTARPRGHRSNERPLAKARARRRTTIGGGGGGFGFSPRVTKPTEGRKEGGTNSRSGATREQTCDMRRSEDDINNNISYPRVTL